MLTCCKQYGGALDVSLDKVPPNHQSLDPGHLEAEGMGLLDRMLSVLHESRYLFPKWQHYPNARLC